jgi:small conductance mechanosensitive channel
MPSSPTRLARLCVVLLSLLALTLTGFAGAAGAQVLPIPGIPNSLGGAGDAGPTAPETQPPADAAPEGAQPGGEATQALIDILRDEAAREALIRELERAAGGGTGDTSATEAEIAPAVPAVETPEGTLGERAAGATRRIAGWTVDQLEMVWLRAQRIPSTFATAGRAFEDGVLLDAIQRVAPLALAIYLSLAVLRLIALPLRRRLSPRNAEAGWFSKLFRRLAVSLLDLFGLLVAVFAGIFILFAIGMVGANADGEAQLSNSEALFVNAFMAVEVAMIVLRLILSPLSPELRLLPLPDGGIRSLWRAGVIVTYTMGYGQLWVVPVISGVSVFVGRAAAAVLSTVVVAGLILFVFVVRRPVADWLTSEDRSLPLSGAMEPIARRWHWPVIGYLGYVLVTVMTRPGNVLLPLLLTTSEVALVILVAAILFGALAAVSAKRVHVPDALGHRLPLLEERLNQLFPAVLQVARLVIVFATLALVLDIVGIRGFGGMLTSEAMERFSSGLFSVLLIVAVLSLVWLGMTSWVDYRLNPFVGSVPTPREITLLTLMKNAVTVALIIIGGITSLAQLGMNVGPLIASAGVIGLAISFGAQRMVEDIFSGIFIQAEGAMNVGDVVDVGGTVGVVEKLTVRSVTLRDLSGVVHVIPFSSAAKISNYMRDYSYHVADIGVAYRENIEEVKEAMHDAFDELRQDEELGAYVIGDLEWFGLNAFGASELVMRARIKTAPGQQWTIGRAYNGIVKRIFDERGIEIPFPHQTVYFGEDKLGRAAPMHLRVEQEGKKRQEREELQAQSGEQETRDVEAQTLHGTDMPASDDS